MEKSASYFCNMSDLGKIRISGTSALTFIKVMTTIELWKLEEVGRAGLSLILNAEGEIIDVVMIARTGELEYLILTHPQTAEELTQWLQAHAELRDSNDALVFEEVLVEDQTAPIATFALFGNAALMVLDELGKTDLGVKLADRNLTLMTIGQLEVLVIRWPFLRAQGQEQPLMLEGMVYEVYLPLQAALDFEEILLGFEELNPESFEEYRARRLQAHSWFLAAEDAAYGKPESEGLKALMRPGGDFVGARALSQAT